MNKDKAEKIISDIAALLDSLRGELNLGLEETRNIKVKKIIPANKFKKRLGLAKSILELMDRGFMNSSKTAMDLSKEFRKQALIYDIDAIRTALMRLVRKGQLEREGEGTTKSPWKYLKK